MALSADQEQALQLFNEGKNIFITGLGGSGKSYLIQLFKTVVESKGKKIYLTALTGCAGILLGPNAKTIHSWSGIGIGTSSLEETCQKIRSRGATTSLRWWRDADILVIDEISMMSPTILELLNSIGKILRNNSKPFGGIQVVFAGDFFQLPPIGGASKDTPKYAFESPIWDEVIHSTVELTYNHRQSDQIFQKILQEVRFSNLSKESIAILESKKIKGNKLPVYFNNLPENSNLTLPIKPTILYSRKADVDATNKQELEKLNNPLQTFIVTSVNANLIPKKQVKINELKIDTESNYIQSLNLCIAAQVMLIINLDLSEGLANGSRGVITSFSEKGLPIVEFLNGKTIEIDYHTWYLSEHESFGRKQIPLCIAYAITIHKSQGATLDYTLVDLGKSLFEDGQAYVALSRVKSLEGLFIYSLDVKKITSNKKVIEFYTML